jgi:uncharacterized membrane protein
VGKKIRVQLVRHATVELMRRLHFNLDKVFEVSVILKAVDAGLELIGGSLLLVLSPHFIDRLTSALTQHELSKNPHNSIATFISHAGHNLAHNSRLFGGLYLLLHGLVKLAVIIGVLKQKLWAYPWLMIVLFAFICFQVWDILHKFTLGLTLLSLFDSFIIVLTWFEWQKHKRQL